MTSAPASKDFKVDISWEVTSNGSASSESPQKTNLIGSDYQSTSIGLNSIEELMKIAPIDWFVATDDS